MKRILTLILLVIVVLLGLSFALMNAQPITLNYYFSTVEAPLSLLIVFALATGAALGVMAVVGLLLNQKRELSKCRKAARLAEKEINNLRSLPMKDTH